MYKYFTTIKSSLVVAVVAGSLLVAGPALAAGKGFGKPGDMNIVETAMDNPDKFSSLVEAILCLSPDPENVLENNPIIDLLSGNRNFTVFAPNNGAFDALLEGADPCSLGVPTLTAVLAYHVKNGRNFSNSVFDIEEPKLLTMYSGDAIMTDGSDFTITDLAEQTIGLGDLINAKASNGVIHEIDTVMLPIPPAE